MTREERLQAQKRYNDSPAGLRRRWRYDASPKRAAAHARYEAKHPERKRRYWKSG